MLFANWVTGKLYVPKGQCIEYVHLGYNSIYETETVIEFNDGVLVSSKTYNNYIAKKSKFRTDPNPNNYLEFVYSKVNWEKLPDLKNKHIQVSIGVQPNKDGQIDSLLSNYTYLLDSSELITDTTNIFIKEAIRIVKLIPDWDLTYQRDTIVRRGLSLMFDENNKRKYAR